MRKLLLSLTAASTVMAAAAVVTPAHAMTAGTASGIQTAIDNVTAIEQAAYVCRHRYYSSRRVCWWRPNYRRWRHRHWRW